MVTKTGQLGFRVEPEKKRLFETAATYRGVTVTRFLEDTATAAAMRELADRSSFTLDPEQMKAWEDLNSEPAKDLAGLRELFDRPSPFIA